MKAIKIIAAILQIAISICIAWANGETAEQKCLIFICSVLAYMLVNQWEAKK